jgi:hypothetical protein
MAMALPKLIEERIAEALERAAMVAFRPGSDRGQGSEQIVAQLVGRVIDNPIGRVVRFGHEGTSHGQRRGIAVPSTHGWDHASPARSGGAVLS